MYALPVFVLVALAVILVLLSAAIASRSTRRTDLVRAGWLPALILVVAGMGGVATARQVQRIVTDPIPPRGERCTTDC